MGLKDHSNLIRAQQPQMCLPVVDFAVPSSARQGIARRGIRAARRKGNVMNRRSMLIVAAASIAAAGSSARADKIVDLTAAGASGSINGALFQQIDVGPAGTGYIDPFVRLHHDQPKGVYEEGYNTDGPIEFQTKDHEQHNWTHSIQVGDVGSVNIGGVDYLQFWLDINEPIAENGQHEKNLLTLQKLQVFISSTGNNTGYATSPSNLGTKIYDMDASPDGNGTVQLDAALAPGSGHFDMIVNIKKELFGPDQNKYIYLFSGFGDVDSFSPDFLTEGGFEEWAHLESAQAVPLPGAAWGGLALLSGLGAFRRLRRRREESVA